MNSSEILIYESKQGDIKIDVQLEEETVWLTQEQMATLFGKAKFSCMYWKSVDQQNLPVTSKYLEMVAEIFPNFKGVRIPEFGKKNLWFL